MKLTISELKADVGSIGGHTKPSRRMMESVELAIADAISSGLLIDGLVGHTGDDICMTTTHTLGPNDTDIHQFAWATFLKATDIAREYGLYGAGTAVAEAEFDHDPVKTNPVRPAESFMVLAAGKCGPGAYNLPMFLDFADPMYCAGLMLARLVRRGHFALRGTGVFRFPAEHRRPGCPFCLPQRPRSRSSGEGG